MAVVVVDRLEAVEVEEEDGHPALVLSCSDQGLGQTLVQKDAVGQAAQGVVQGAVGSGLGRLTDDIAPAAGGEDDQPDGEGGEQEDQGVGRGAVASQGLLGQAVRDVEMEGEGEDDQRATGHGHEVPEHAQARRSAVLALHALPPPPGRPWFSSPIRVGRLEGRLDSSFGPFSGNYASMLLRAAVAT